ncbi:arylsulfatase [Lentisphaera profundi]|uniref:Arylsulfatase n=1 Tax=Lentisphaera profundi TaxID=1658616 RepID=A0ABY7VW69_9BACT|nr:arylsulfatase [Lentisphaera profundi]WDE98480.1 arylsulfatase [Lentisphaera profundi]
MAIYSKTHLGQKTCDIKVLIYLLFFSFGLMLPLFARERKANVILILADDQGWGDLSLHGNTNIRTPHIDSLAHQGAQFSRFYVSAVCAPTRASLLTGRYHWRTGVLGVDRGEERLNLDEVSLADILKKAGYATGCFGKWHNGSHYPYHPLGRGFDEFYGFCSGHWSNYFNTKMDHNGQEVQGKGFIADDLTNKAIEFIEENKDKPFFCYIPYNTPHSPFQVPDAFFDKVKKRGLKFASRYAEKEDKIKTMAALAMCENIDWNLGRVLAKLKELNLEDNTIVIYLSDNGPNSWRWNSGYKGKKSSLDEGGLRVPFLIRWPGEIEAGLKIEAMCTHIDLLPTLCDLLAIDFEIEKKLDGRSFRPLLKGEAPQMADRFLYSKQKQKISLRSNQYLATKKALYDLVNDPGQRVNLSQIKPDVYHAMQVSLKQMFGEIDDSSKDRLIPVGYREFPLTKLAVQDAGFSDTQIKFSSKYANEAWVKGWNDVNSFLFWEIDVQEEGLYQVELLYTAAQAGDDLLIECGEARLEARINEIFDPELIHSPDRVPRSETYEKPFKRVLLGQLNLSSGPKKLNLKCLKKQGDSFINVKALHLKLLK